MSEKIPSLENSSKERLLFVCKNRENLELIKFPLAHIDTI